MNQQLLHQDTSSDSAQDEHDQLQSSMLKSGKFMSTDGTSRISKIKSAVLAGQENQFSKTGHTTNIQSLLYEQTPAPKDLTLLKETYAAHKRQGSKSRERESTALKMIPLSSFSNEVHRGYVSQTPLAASRNPVHGIENTANKFKRSTAKHPQDYHQKYQKLEENFKKFSESVIADRKKLQQPTDEIPTQAVTSEEQQMVTLLGFQYPAKPLPAYSQNEKSVGDRQQALAHMLHQLQAHLQQSLAKVTSMTSKEGNLNFICKQNPSLSNEQTRVQNLFQFYLEQTQQRLAQIEEKHVSADVLKMYTDLLEEAYQLQPNDLLNALVHSVKMHKAQAAVRVLQSSLRGLCKRKMAFWFKKWQNKPNRNSVLKRVITHLRQVSNLRDKASTFQKWRLLRQTSSEQLSLVQRLILDRQVFNECIESDAGLLHNLSTLVKQTKKIDMDIVLIGVDPEVLNVYDFDAQEVVSFDIKPCLTYAAIQQTYPKQESSQSSEIDSETSTEIQVIQGLAKQPNFDSNIDMPMFDPEVMSYLGDNVSAFMVPLMTDHQSDSQAEAETAYAVMRVYQSNQIQCNKAIFERIKSLACQVQGFINRVHQLRFSFGTLAGELIQFREMSRIKDLETCVHNCLYSILQGSLEGNKQDFLQLLQSKTTDLLHSLMPDLSDCFLRQIYILQRDADQNEIEAPLFSEDQDTDIKAVTLTTMQEDEEDGEKISLDYFEHSNDSIIMQISVQNMHNTIKAVVQRVVPFESKDDNQFTNESKYALMYFVRAVEPVIIQGLKIHEVLAAQIEKRTAQLYKQVQFDRVNAYIRSKFQGLQQRSERDSCTVIQETLEQLVLNHSQISGLQVESVSLMISEVLQTGCESDVHKLIGYLTPRQVKVFSRDELEDNSQESDEVQRYELDSSSLNDFSLQLKQEDQSTLSLKLSAYHDETLLGAFLITLRSSTTSSLPALKQFTSQLALDFETHLQKYYRDSLHYGQFKQTAGQLEHRQSVLGQDVQFMKSVQAKLVLPFTNNPQLKKLADSLVDLVTSCMPMIDVGMVKLYQNNQLILDDVQNMHFSSSNETLDDQEHSVRVNSENQAIELLLQSNDRQLLLEFHHDQDKEQEGLLIQHIEVLQAVITPFVTTALASLTQSFLPVRQEQLPRIISKVIQMRKLTHATQIFAALKGYQSNKVPIFTKLDSFFRIAQRVQQQRNQVLSQQQSVQTPNHTESEVFDGDDEFNTKLQVLQVYTQVFDSLNRITLQSKRQAFNHYSQQVLDQLAQEQEQLQRWAAYQPSKQQRKAFSIMAALAGKLERKATFGRLAVYTTCFRYLNTPTLRRFTGALCLQSRYSQFKKRLGFQKLKGEVAKRNYRSFVGVNEKDRDFMLELQREMLQVLPQIDQSATANSDLESHITAVLERAMIYLQQSMLPETLDVIVCSLVQAKKTNTKYRAYLFNKNSDTHDQTQALDELDQSMAGSTQTKNEDMQDFKISMTRDIILQMLQKSNSMFNFSNISNSLLDLYRQQFSDEPADRDVQQRMTLLAKAKAALLCPLQIENQDGEMQLIGSLELYRFYNQVFDQEMEARIRVFTQALQDLCNVFIQMRRTQLQISTLKQSVCQAAKPIKTLTGLLAQAQRSGLVQMQAPHFQVYLLNEQQNLAYFYVPHENLMYSFDYEGSAVDELQEMNHCVLELQSAPELSIFAQESPEQSAQELNDVITSLESSYHSQAEQVSKKHRRRRRLESSLRTLTNIDGFHRLFYYPVLSWGDNFTLKAVVEVGFTKPETAPTEILAPPIKTMVSQLATHLQQFSLRLKQLLSSGDAVLTSNQMVSKQRAFMSLKHYSEQQREKAQFEATQTQTITQTQKCLDDYLLNLESYDQELKKLADQRAHLAREAQSLQQDRQNKFKLLATCLMAINKQNQREHRRKLQSAFSLWRGNATVAKVVETAFNKMLELNYKHAQGRFKAASFMLKKACDRRLKKIALDNVTSFARMTQLSQHVPGAPIQVNSFQFDSGIKSVGSYSQQQRAHVGQASIKSTTNIMSGDQTSFSNIAGPFQKTNLMQSQLQYQSLTQSQTSGSATPISISVNQQQASHLHQKHLKAGLGSQSSFGEQPVKQKTLVASKMRTTATATGKKRKATSKVAGKSAPQTGRIVIS